MILSPIIAFSQINQEVTNRKEFTYCPNTSILGNLHYINGSLAKTSVEGCPLNRIYIEDWNNISVLDQTQIKSQLLSNGWQEVN